MKIDEGHVFEVLMLMANGWLGMVLNWNVMAWDMLSLQLSGWKASNQAGSYLSFSV